LAAEGKKELWQHALTHNKGTISRVAGIQDMMCVPALKQINENWPQAQTFAPKQQEPTQQLFNKLWWQVALG